MTLSINNTHFVVRHGDRICPALTEIRKDLNPLPYTSIKPSLGVLGNSAHKILPNILNYKAMGDFSFYMGWEACSTENDPWFKNLNQSEHALGINVVAYLGRLVDSGEEISLVPHIFLKMMVVENLFIFKEFEKLREIPSTRGFIEMSIGLLLELGLLKRVNTIIFFEIMHENLLRMFNDGKDIFNREEKNTLGYFHNLISQMIFSNPIAKSQQIRIFNAHTREIEYFEDALTGNSQGRPILPFHEPFTDRKYPYVFCMEAEYD